MRAFLSRVGLRIVATLLLSVLIYGILFYLQNYEPDQMRDLLLRVDVWGLTPAVRQEQERLERIKALDISYEQKNVLIDRTVFIGASDEMVKLALGEPRKIMLEKTQGLIDFVYYMPGDMRPTIFVFQGNILIKAFKSSVLDVPAEDRKN